MSYSLEYGEFRNRPLAYLRENQPSYDDAYYLARTYPKTFELPEFFASSDYHGSFVELSNYKVWCEEHAETEGITWWDLGEEHGILVRLNLLLQSEREALDGLDGYPVLDEQAWSECEGQACGEDWESYGACDFRHDLMKEARSRDELDEDDLDALETMLDNASNAQLWSLWESFAIDYPETETEGRTTLFRYEKDIQKRWDGTLATIEDWLYGEPLWNEDKTAYLVLATVDCYDTVRVLREPDMHEGRVRDDVLETWSDIATREERSNYCVISNDIAGRHAS